MNMILGEVYTTIQQDSNLAIICNDSGVNRRVWLLAPYDDDTSDIVMKLDNGDQWVKPQNFVVWAGRDYDADWQVYDNRPGVYIDMIAMIVYAMQE